MTTIHLKRESLAKDFLSFLPQDSVLSQVSDLSPYECDGLSAYRVLPLLVLLPYNEAQVQNILRYCHQHQLPVVARGAGTGLSGGALPLENGIILSLARFNKIISIDVKNSRATVQPGVRNLAISDAAKADNLHYAPDPSSQIACTIGGNVAENAGGVHCLKYGLTVNNLLAVRLITIEGEVLTFGGQALDSPGYDLLALVTGSEGMLGVITEVTVKLLPIPDSAKVILAAFDDVQKAGKTVADIISNGIIPAGLEMMDNPAILAADDFVHAGYPRDAAALLLCELDGIASEVDANIIQVSQIILDAGATKVSVAKDETERQLFWKGRKNAFPAVGRISPDYYCMDGTIPRKHLGQILQTIADLSAHYSLKVANVFHAGDGNMHPLILYNANNPGELEKAEEFGGKILEACVAVGGSITGEHGVGLEKINQMCVQYGSDELTQFHSVKSAFDPQQLLNPGKAIPTLNHCAEFGAMHVHHGKLSHPELERF